MKHKYSVAEVVLLRKLSARVMLMGTHLEDASDPESFVDKILLEHQVLTWMRNGTTPYELKEYLKGKKK